MGSWGHVILLCPYGLENDCCDERSRLRDCLKFVKDQLVEELGLSGDWSWREMKYNAFFLELKWFSREGWELLTNHLGTLDWYKPEVVMAVWQYEGEEYVPQIWRPNARGV